MSRKRRRHGDFGEFILLALMKEGPLTLNVLKKITTILVSQFETVGVEFGTRIVSGFFSKFGRPAIVRSSREKQEKKRQDIDIKYELENLQKTCLVKLNQMGSYELTAKGEEKAKEFEKNLKKSVEILKGQFLSPSAAARNTIMIDFFLAALKLLSGVFSGSVGL